MSVLIKGTEMPDCCAACPLRNQELFKDGKYVYGCSLCGGWGTGQTRAYDCPLVEIPTPHGDLIDRGDVIDEINRIFPCHSDEYEWAYTTVEQADTIIEAEE